jgi:hypothetical protein
VQEVLRIEVQDENHPGQQVPATSLGVVDREGVPLPSPVPRVSAVGVPMLPGKFTNDTDCTNNTSLEPRPQASYTPDAT